MITREKVIAALDAHPEHDAALPALREWAESGDESKFNHILSRLNFPPPRKPGVDPPLLGSRPSTYAEAAVHYVGSAVKHAMYGGKVDDATFAARRESCMTCSEYYDPIKHACK